MITCAFLFTLIISLVMATNQTPYIRSKLARSIYNKMLKDDELKHMDRDEWYNVDASLLKDDVLEKFVQLTMDSETEEFLANCFEQSDHVFYQLGETFAKSFLSLFMSPTSVNGLLNRGRMFVWSRDHAKILLNNTVQCCNVPSTFLLNHQRPSQTSVEKGHSSSPANSGQFGAVCYSDDLELEPWAGKVILDLGAGDGFVTRILGDHAKEVFVTEASQVMQKRLRERGYKVLDEESWYTTDAKYDIILCLNLLDRCSTPKTLLGQIHQKMNPDSKLVVAIVLPFNPYVEYGSSNHQPLEHIELEGTNSEEQINNFVQNVFPAAGFLVQKWSKVPYLCEGDLDQSFYMLNDYIFILRKI